MIRQQPKRLGVRAQIKLGDSESLPWVDASFDYVFGVDSFHPYPNPKRALNEFHRARKPRVAVENDIHGLESGNICHWRVHARPCETLEVIFTYRLHFGWC